jgi:acetyl esterase/lipase
MSRWTQVLLVVVLISCGSSRLIAEEPATQPALKHPEAPADIHFEPDIVYATVDGEPLMLDLSSPANVTEALPCIVVIHGGGWSAGDRAQLDGVTFNLAHRNYISVTLEYRMAPRHRFPAAVQDVKAAVRYLRGNADKLHIDPQHIGAVGFSAGAHLAMMLGTMDKADGLDDVGDFPDQSSKVQAVVSFFGPTDLTTEYPDVSKAIVRNFIGGDISDMPDAYRRASPITYVSAGDAPMLLFQGTADPLVPYNQAVLMIGAMQKAGVPGRAELISGAGHGWGGPDFARTVVEAVEFFDKYLKEKKETAK